MQIAIEKIVRLDLTEDEAEMLLNILRLDTKQSRDMDDDHHTFHQRLEECLGQMLDPYERSSFGVQIP